MKKLLFLTAFIFAAQISQAQWESDVRLTNDLSSSEISFSSQCGVAISGHTVHVVWWDDRDGNYEIYYKRSTNDGIGWGEDTRLTSNDAESNWPSIAVADSVVHVVWVDNRDGNTEVYYKRSTDGGMTWGTDSRFTNTPGYSEYTYPSIAVSGSFVHVVWDDSRDGNYEIYYKCSTDGGMTWGPDKRLTFNTAISGWPSVAVSSSVVHIIWYDSRDGNNEIYYKRSADGGSNWETDTRLTNNGAISKTGSIAVSDSVVHVVWWDDRDGNYEIYYKRSTDGGSEWESDKRLSNNLEDYGSRLPTIAVSGPIVHVAWFDWRDGNAEIYYKCSIDEGRNWGEDTRLTDDSAYSGCASITVSDSIVHVVWIDNRDGNNEIYYKRNPTGNIIVGIENEASSMYGERISIYPNPASRQLTVDSRQFAVGSSQSAVNSQQSAVRISIVDLYGREIKSSVNISSFPFQVDISDLSDGFYFLCVISDDGLTVSAKFLKIEE